MKLPGGRGARPEQDDLGNVGAEIDAGATPEGQLLTDESPISAPVVILASVNLLPHVYAKRAAAKRARGYAIGMAAAALLMAALGWLVAWQQQTSAQESLDEATAERAVLQTEAARYAEVPKVLAAVDAAEGQMELAMANEVRWSFFLNDLALTMPSGVSLDTLTVTSPHPGDAAAAAAPSSASASAISAGSTGAGVPGIGTMTVSAKAFTYNRVANWLDSLAKLSELSDPYVSTISAGSEQGTDLVSYSSTATITPEAMSKRYLPQEVSQ